MRSLGKHQLDVLTPFIRLRQGAPSSWAEGLIARLLFELIAMITVLIDWLESTQWG